MKLARFEKFGNVRYGIYDEERGEIREITGPPFGKITVADAVHKLDDVKILPPVEPTKIVGVGLNYRDHAKEMGKKIPDEPLIFLKPTSAIIGHGDSIVLPRMSGRVDYEAELAIVIGKKAKDVSEEDAKKYILGYTCFNDVTARDLQAKDGLYARAKGFDTFAPFGPFIETDLEPDDLKVRARVNGQVKQDGTTKKMIFDVYTLVSFISSIMTLNPGDLIATGTPPGIGPLKPGDVVEVEIEGIGSLVNNVIHFRDTVESE
ncbi:MAG: FAA hydrolase family protein [Deltaproteobacteria bacterium]|nr:MAG: FAA hydrolase family protein [Deltaproteobacteria bacterium]